jgi:hypothetical protein
MSVTFSAMAGVASQSAMAFGQAQASSMGLGQTEANALAVTNLMGGDSSGGAGPMNKQEFGASVVTQTINNLNQNGKKKNSSGLGMDFQMSVLGAGLAGKGGIINVMG